MIKTIIKNTMLVVSVIVGCCILAYICEPKDGVASTHSDYYEFKCLSTDGWSNVHEHEETRDVLLRIEKSLANIEMSISNSSKEGI